VLDATCIAVAWSAAALRHPATPAPLAIATGATATGMAELIALRLHRSRGCSLRSVEIGRLLRVAVASALGAWGAAAVAGGRLPSSAAVVGALATLLLLAITRAWVAAWFRARRARGIGVRTVILIGANAEAEEMATLLGTRPDLGYRVVAVAGSHPDRHGPLATLPWLGDPDKAIERARGLGATGVVVAVTALDRPELHRLVRLALDANLHVQMSSGLGLLGHRRLVRTPVGHDPWCYVEANTHGRIEGAAKCLLDLAVTVPLLLLALPVLAVASVAIKLEDGGPVLFRQVRVGRGGRPFHCLKLRTMSVDAEHLLEQVRNDNERSGPLFKSTTDPRVTRVGRILRASSLDEVPQLLNVLRRDMSLVGPRPALPEEAQQFDDALRERELVLPGLTGLWQVEARDNPSFHAYRHLDLFYIENRSLVLDLTIIALTPATVAARLWRTERGVPHAAPDDPELVDLVDATQALEAS
jgi:exopolysaccharide biosynthesis polyprenyl glycosylphosphotransferase